MGELDQKWQSPGVFICSQKEYSDAKVVMLGAPMDYTVSFKAGSRFGPQGIRGASHGLEEYSPYLDGHLSDVPFIDQGDLVLPIGNVEKSMEMIYTSVKQVLADNKIPLVLGGEHLITYPIIRAMVEKYPDLVLLQFDAHTDLRDTFFAEKHSHATVIRRCVELLGKKRVYQYGIRSGEQHEFRYADEMTYMRRYRVMEGLLEDLPDLQGKPVFITFDIDCIDPAYCPGTGTPEPGGISTVEALEAIHAMKQLNIVGMDLVEVSPQMDPGGITEIAAAKLLREAMIAYWGK